MSANNPQDHSNIDWSNIDWKDLESFTLAAEKRLHGGRKRRRLLSPPSNPPVAPSPSPPAAPSLPSYSDEESDDDGRPRRIVRPIPRRPRFPRINVMSSSSSSSEGGTPELVDDVSSPESPGSVAAAASPGSSPGSVAAAASPGSPGSVAAAAAANPDSSSSDGSFPGILDLDREFREADDFPFLHVEAAAASARAEPSTEPDMEQEDSAAQVRAFVPTDKIRDVDINSPSLKTLIQSFMYTHVIDYSAGGRLYVNLLDFAIEWQQVLDHGRPSRTMYSQLRNFSPERDRQYHIFFMKNVFARMQDVHSRGDMPHTNGHFLSFDISSVKNLKIALFIYLVYRMCIVAEPGRYNTIAGTSSNWSLELVTNEEFTIRVNHSVLLSEVLNLYSKVMALFFNHLLAVFSDDYDNWEDVNSGEVMEIADGVMVGFKAEYVRIASYRVGTRWNAEMGKILEEMFKNRAIATVKNETDDLCLFYCIAMGFLQIKWGYNNVFPKKFLEVNELNRKYEKVDERDPGKKLLMDIKHKREEMESFIAAHKDIYNTKEVYTIFREIEEKFVDPNYALDIYMGDISTKEDCYEMSRIYPCYTSARAVERRIPLVSISFRNFNHYFLITCERRLFSETGGKMFYTCSICRQSYYSKTALNHHVHHGDRDAKKDHWSSIAESDDEPVGVCIRCHLKFKDEDDFEYHKKHCFMKQRSGTRFVELPNVPVLKGVEVPEGDFELPEKKIYFADFECAIHEDGEHEFMSYGLYNPNEIRGYYYEGYKLETFINHLKEESKRHETIYVYFHNAMGYDVNFILRYILRHEKEFTISVIMKSMNKFQAVRLKWKEPGNKTIYKIIIGDTFHFMTMSLDNIVSSLRKDDVEANMHTFVHFFGTFHEIYDPTLHLTNESIDRVLHKNLFPYKFFTSPDKLKTPEFTFRDIFEPREENLKYFSEGITIADLQANLGKFRKVWHDFKMHFARDYHSVYLLCDVLQIADVFLKARRTLAETHKIDLCDYIGMPSASWHAFLRFNPRLELPLYTNTKYAEFFASMTRGGVTSAPLRWAKSDATHSIIYFDVNGLYPHVMRTYKYPTGEMFWLDFEERHNANPTEYFMKTLVPYFESRGRGCCICVDLHVPDEVKLLTDQFPFAPEHRLLRDCYLDEGGSLYPFLKKWSVANNGEKMKPFMGLVGTLYDKKEYGVHWRLLKWYVEHGLIITKLHHAVFFDEGDYLKDYITLNIECRNKRDDALGKMVYKLLGNSIYGKTFESPFNRGKFYIIRNRDKLRGLLEEGNLASITAIDEDNSIVKMDGDSVVLDKPTYIGACVTEYAKLHMYELFYDKLKPIFPAGLELVYTDTDSFIIRVAHPPGMTSKALFAYIENKCPGLVGSVGGQIKSETGEDLIEEVIALRSKLYCYRTQSGKIGKRAKGTTTAAREQQLTWEKYENAMKDLVSVYTENELFKRHALKITSVRMGKCSISVNDGKRYILPDGIHTHAFGFSFNEDE